LFTPKAQPARARKAKASATAIHLADTIKNARLGLIGEHPVGFDTCRYEDTDLATLAGITVEKITLDDTFTRARAVDAATTAPRLAKARETYAGLDEVDQGQLTKSLALHAAMEDLRTEKKLDGIAMRCWPETFTEYGCAVCGPMGMMTEAGTPCACEADVYGALTALLMQSAAGSPAWLVDIVDMDAASDTGVIWHCGSAPLSMCDPAFAPEAQIHSNRKMPLLAQFPLKPGRITIARISQAKNGLTLVLGAGEVVSAPMSFTGTSGVVRFDGGTKAAMDVLLGETLEHHIAITYGDTRAALEGWAALKNLPVLDLTA
jgi:L-fucose isomerase-like protein